MNIQELLKPLIENEDYVIVANQLVALPKIRLVDQLIHHPEIAEVLCERMEEIDGVFKLNKNAVSVAGVPAYDEVIHVPETYYSELPNLEDLKMSHIPDLALAIGEYLFDKQALIDTENDSLNICDGKIVRFGFKNIPMPTADSLLDCYNIAVAKQASAAEKAEAKAYLYATDYHILKAAELGVKVAPEILAARAAARLKLQN